MSDNRSRRSALLDVILFGAMLGLPLATSQTYAYKGASSDFYGMLALTVLVPVILLLRFLFKLKSTY